MIRKIIGASWGDPTSYKTYCGVPARVFQLLEDVGIMHSSHSTKRLYPIDTVSGLIDFKKSFSYKRPKLNFVWRYYPLAMRNLSRRFERRLNFNIDDRKLLQFECAIIPERFKVYSHVEITLQTALNIPLYSNNYGLADLSKFKIARAIEGQKVFFDSCEKIWTNSTYTAQGFYDLGVPKEKVFTFAPRATFEPTVNLDRDFSTPKILFIGRDWNRKGLLKLVKAFSILKKEKKDAQLTVIGNNLNLGDGVRYLGEVSNLTERGRGRFQYELDNHNVFCLPSDWESTGISSMEAAIAGLIVVMSRGQNREEIFSESVHEFLEENTADGIYEKIKNLFSGEVDLKQKSIQTINHANQHYTWSNNIDKLSEFLDLGWSFHERTNSNGIVCLRT